MKQPETCEWCKEPITKAAYYFGEHKFCCKNCSKAWCDENGVERVKKEVVAKTA